MIKFRAWQKYHEKMLEVHGIEFGENGRIEAIKTFYEKQMPQKIIYSTIKKDFYLYDENGEMVLELLQFTGLHDKNGTPIYEGDIIRFCDHASDRTGGHMGDSIITGEVTYDYAMFFVKDNEETGFPLCDAHLNDDELEVIGNKFEGIKEESK